MKLNYVKILIVSFLVTMLGSNAMAQIEPFAQEGNYSFYFAETKIQDDYTGEVDAWNILIEDNSSGQREVVMTTRYSEVLFLEVTEEGIVLIARDDVYYTSFDGDFENEYYNYGSNQTVRVTPVTVQEQTVAVCGIEWNGNSNAPYPKTIYANYDVLDYTFDCTPYIAVSAEDFSTGAELFYTPSEVQFFAVSSQDCWVLLDEIPAGVVLVEGPWLLIDGRISYEGTRYDDSEIDLAQLLTKDYGVTGRVFSTNLDISEPEDDTTLCNWSEQEPINRNASTVPISLEPATEE